MKWHRCIYDDTGMHLTPLPWADFGQRSYINGQCLETFYESRLLIPLPNWLTNSTQLKPLASRLEKIIPATNGPELRDATTGQLLWRGPHGDFSEWKVSPNGHFIVGVIMTWPNVKKLVMYDVTPPIRWPWMLSILAVTVALWRWKTKDLSSRKPASTSAASRVVT